MRASVESHRLGAPTVKRCERHGVLNCARCPSETVGKSESRAELETRVLHAENTALRAVLVRTTPKPMTHDTDMCKRCKQAASSYVTVSGFAVWMPKFEQCPTCKGETPERGFCTRCRDTGSIPSRLCADTDRRRVRDKLTKELVASPHAPCRGGEPDARGIRIDPEECKRCAGKTPRWSWCDTVCVACATEETNGGRASRHGYAVSFTGEGHGGEEYERHPPELLKGKLRPMCTGCQQRYAKADGLCGWCLHDVTRLSSKRVSALEAEQAALRAEIESLAKSLGMNQA